MKDTEHLHLDWELVDEYPSSPELQAMPRVWTSRAPGKYVVAAKGAPEAVADLCHLNPDPVGALAADAREMGARGLRVLAVARAQFTGATLPRHQRDFTFELLGPVGLAEPRLAIDLGE